MPLFDKKDKSRYAAFTRRTVGMGIGMSSVFAVLAGRLYQLQIRNGDQYMVEAEDNRVSERLIAPPRGRIMDRFGAGLPRFSPSNADSFLRPFGPAVLQVAS